MIHIRRRATLRMKRIILNFYKLTGHKDTVSALLVVGRLLIGGSFDSSVRVWTLRRGDSTHCHARACSKPMRAE
jgi:WD40 repeat protein